MACALPLSAQAKIAVERIGTRRAICFVTVANKNNKLFLAYLQTAEC
jgi:hypothetical protein